MLLELRKKFLFLKKCLCSLFLIFIFAINGKSLADTVNVSSDTTIDSPVYLDSDIKEDRTYNITNNAVYTLDAEIEASGYTLTKTGNGTFVLNASSSGTFSSSISIDEGLVGIGDDDAFGSATVILNGGGISSSNTSSRTHPACALLPGKPSTPARKSVMTIALS